MKIYGKEVDFKISRLKDAENLEMALRELETAEKKIGEGSGTLKEVFEKGITMFKKFFLKATGEDVLGECSDFEEAKEAYLEFLDEIKKQKRTILSFTVEDIK